MLWLIAHTELFFPVLPVGLMLVAEIGFRLRPALPGADAEFRSVIESARDGPGILPGLLLGFSLLMALPHYEQRAQLVTDEADTIAMVAQRTEMLPEPFRDKILQPLRAYIDARLAFANAGFDKRTMMGASIKRNVCRMKCGSKR